MKTSEKNNQSSNDPVVRYAVTGNVKHYFEQSIKAQLLGEIPIKVVTWHTDFLRLGPLLNSGS